MRKLISKITNRFGRRDTRASRQPEKLSQILEFRQSDVENSKLFATRIDLVKYFAPQLLGGTIAEVGVMYGDFSEPLIQSIKPELFVAIDTFRMHEVSIIWNKASSDRFRGVTHRGFYEKRFAGSAGQVRCEEGTSWEILSKYPNGFFDMIYIDAAHDYESVKRDAEVAKEKIKSSGMLIFNDYIRYSHYEDCYYGVVPVVNELVVKQGFEVVGFALNSDMYCDIAVRRRDERN